VKPGAATAANPDPAELATSDALIEAERSMKAAARDLGPSGDITAAVKSMQKAGRALERAAHSVGER
jgi:hypothetical protein